MVIHKKGPSGNVVFISGRGSFYVQDEPGFPDGAWDVCSRYAEGESPVWERNIFEKARESA